MPPGVFFSSVQCEWIAPPDGDPYPTHTNVLGTPLAASFGFIGQASLGAQIVFTSYAGTDGGFASGSCCGIIRVLDGETCEQMYSLGDHLVVGASPPAIGDLDNAPDLRPEIVALAEGGGLAAFRYDELSDAFVLLWHSTEADGVTPDTFGSAANRWNGPVLADIAFDDRPEVFFDGVIYDADGVKITSGLGWTSFKQGIWPKVAAAGKGAYTVFDPECVEPLPAGCTSVGVRWTRPSQDYSSSVTGSSVFDFEGDGTAEAVYGDECFTRVYDGLTGQVLSSGPRSSCTWHENPIVADVDGDFRSEIVVGSNTNCGIGCPALDPIHDGLRCDGADECVSGACLAGFCRCAAAAECPAGYACAAMLPAGEDGLGQVCRSAHTGKTGGIRVFRDLKDRWVHSRPIWNQHPYFITNVDEFGGIPAKGALPPNWTTDGLNNFRQNTQGDAAALAAPDLTAKAAAGKGIACNEDGTLTAKFVVCNRGNVVAPPGVSVEIYAGEPGDTTSPICETATAIIVAPSSCQPIECVGSAPPGTTSIWASIDSKTSGTGEYLECVEGNNKATAAVTCL